VELNPFCEANNNSVKKFPTVYENRRFVTVLTKARHWSRYWARCIRYTNFRPVSPRSILIFSSHLHLGLPCGLFPSVIYDQNCAPIYHQSHACYMPRPSHPPCSVTLTLLGEPYKLWSSLLCSVLQPHTHHFLPLRSTYSRLKHPQSVIHNGMEHKS
jgi:hypothetical protein